MVAQQVRAQGQRRFPRVPLAAKVDLKFDATSHFLTVQASNVSLGGMFVRTAHPQPVASMVLFLVRPDNERQLLKGSGEVVWIRERDQAQDRPSGMGIRFYHLDSGREVITQLVERHLRDS